MSKTKVDIISGFLGAGKTTFIKRVLEGRPADEKTVLIENEFGEVGIDGGFLKNSGIEIREMNSGCICCSLVGDFSENLKEILEKYQPERVIIEPSGVGKLSDVLKAVADVEEKFGLENNCAVTVVDAKKARLYTKNFGEFFNNQIQNAKVIVLSRTDIMTQEKIEEAVRLVKEINAKAKIIDTPISELSNEKLLEILESDGSLEQELLREVQAEHESLEHRHHHDHDHHHDHGESCTCGCHEHHHHQADEIFDSWGSEQLPPIEETKLRELLDELSEGSDYGVVLRAKGMLRDKNSDKWIYFDVVPGEVIVRNGEPDYTGKACVIGTRLNTEKLEEVFKG